jgi:hypothetical protein
VVEDGHLVGHDEHEIAHTARLAERALSGATSTVVRRG